MGLHTEEIPVLNPKNIEAMLSARPVVAAAPAGGGRRDRKGFVSMGWDDYDAHPAISRSTLDKISVSPKHLQHYLQYGGEDSAALAFGRVLHTLILEPETEQERIAVFGGKVRNGKAWDEFLAVNFAKDIVTAAELDRARRMRDAFMAHRLAKGCLAGASVEACSFWKDEPTGVERKARLDIVGDHWVYDLKSSSDLTTEAFTRDVYRYGYHRQAAWYLDAASAAAERPYSGFGLIVVEKEEPFQIRIFRLDDAAIARGREENRANLELYARCLKNDEWPGFPALIETLSLPRWT